MNFRQIRFWIRNGMSGFPFGISLLNVGNRMYPAESAVAKRAGVSCFLLDPCVLLKMLGCNVCTSRFQEGICLLWCMRWDHWHGSANGIACLRMQPDPVALLKEQLVHTLLMPVLLWFLQIRPPADQKQLWWRCLLRLHMWLCVYRMKYCFKFTILSLCTLHTLNMRELILSWTLWGDTHPCGNSLHCSMLT